ncbi:MAG: protein translocase subunit SecDF, partial [Christensenellaceae bacterium]
AFVTILQLQINSGFIAGCLTIIGYSINNTIVIFDRIRDNRKGVAMKGRTRAEIANTSIAQTLSRTINTSVTTLIMIVCLYILGVDSIKEFSLPIIVGLLAGTYSSVFLSGPMWALMSNAADKRNAKNAANGKIKKNNSKKAKKGKTAKA